MTEFNYYQPTEIRFGCGRLSEVGEAVLGYGKTCLLVTGSNIPSLEPSFTKLMSSLKDAGVTTVHFDGVIPNPTTDTIKNGAIMANANNVDVVGIDEAQFFDDGLVAVCNQLANSGIRVIVAGLDMDFKGVPFGPMPGLMACAEYVTKVHAICMRCGDLANHSYRFSEKEELVLLGEVDEYEPLCRSCYNNATNN